MSDEDRREPILSPTAEKFAVLLEARMIAGNSDTDNRTWAITDMGVPAESFERIRALILRTWKLEVSTLGAVNSERDRVRVSYWEIYRRAMEKEKLSDALRALDSISRLEGLDQPTRVEIGLGQGGITNSARETLVTLIQRMKELGEGKTVKSLKAFRDGADSAIPDEPTRANGTNGHHAKKIIDVSEGD